MIVHPSDRGAWWAPKDDNCFLCREDIPRDVVSVMWGSGAAVQMDDGSVVGCGVDIGLHIDCAAKLGAHLIGDAREARLAQGDAHWSQRADHMKKTRLERQEWQS